MISPRYPPTEMPVYHGCQSWNRLRFPMRPVIHHGGVLPWCSSQLVATAELIAALPFHHALKQRSNPLRSFIKAPLNPFVQETTQTVGIEPRLLLWKHWILQAVSWLLSGARSTAWHWAGAMFDDRQRCDRGYGGEEKRYASILADRPLDQQRAKRHFRVPSWKLPAAPRSHLNHYGHSVSTWE